MDNNSQIISWNNDYKTLIIPFNTSKPFLFANLQTFADEVAASSANLKSREMYKIPWGVLMIKN